MADKGPQTRENHVRYDPAFHFFLTPVSFLVLIWTIVHFVRHMDSTNGLLAALALLLFLAIFKMRLYSLKVQDRVIRLEERLRLSQLIPGSAVPDLKTSQFVALRFASDSEVAALAQKAAAENMDGKQIKAAIQTWRPDYWRV